MDTSLIDVDVQPTYVRVTVKGKVSAAPHCHRLRSHALDSARLPEHCFKLH